ncbi:UNVERIFIED_CONTAM: hypothetical protein GTU68_044130 [Idotea baltica]|nr:hypothetical protein [Idotea baltica]
MVVPFSSFHISSHCFSSEFQ